MLPQEIWCCEIAFWQHLEVKDVSTTSMTLTLYILMLTHCSDSIFQRYGSEKSLKPPFLTLIGSGLRLHPVKVAIHAHGMLAQVLVWPKPDQLDRLCQP